MAKQIKMQSKLPVISIKKILCTAGDCLSMIGQWGEIKDDPDWISAVFSNSCQATVLIELVEEFDCGSHGGFGDNQPSGQSLFERWMWLCTKYNLNYDAVKNYGWKTKQLKKLFIRSEN